MVDRSAGCKVRYCRFSCGGKTLWKFERDAVVGGVQLLRTRSPVWRKWKVYSRTFPLNILMQLYKNMRSER